MSYDVRSVANFILDEADLRQIPVTNLSLNKIAYFFHAEHLASEGIGLVSAKIEAWKYGPVYREIYNQFKTNQNLPIKNRAKSINKKLGILEVCSLDFEEHTWNKLKQWSDIYLKLSPFQLVELSHIPNGAWDQVYHHTGKSNPGMHISNEIIVSTFRRQSRH